MKQLSLLAAVLCAAAVSAQTPKIVVQGSGAPEVFSSMVDAIGAATATDIIYLSGGEFQLVGEVLVDHEVHIVGAGCHPDSAGLTGVSSFIGTGRLVFTTPGSNSSVTGVLFNVWPAAGQFLYGQSGQNNGDCTNMLFARCAFYGPLWLQGTSTTTYVDCYVAGGITSAEPVTIAQFNNCVVANATSTAFATVNFDHCIHLNAGGGGNFMSYQNCIVALSTLGGINYAVAWTNCLFYNVTPFTQNVNACVFTNDNPFVDNPNVNFDWADDLRVMAGSQGVGLATDGTDVGIFGGPTPFKPGFVPYNPHYTQLQIAPATNANGELPVNITVVRQTN